MIHFLSFAQNIINNDFILTCYSATELCVSFLYEYKHSHLIENNIIVYLGRVYRYSRKMYCTFKITN